jgi:Arc/MetJ family transcription regulator
MRKYGVHTKTEAVDRALREVAFQPMSTAEILALRGTGFLDAPADQSPRG